MAFARTDVPGDAEQRPCAVTASRCGRLRTAARSSPTWNGLGRHATPSGSMSTAPPVIIRHRLAAAGSCDRRASTRSAPRSAPRLASTSTASYPAGSIPRASLAVDATSTSYPHALSARLMRDRIWSTSSTISTLRPTGLYVTGQRSRLGQHATGRIGRGAARKKLPGVRVATAAGLTMSSPGTVVTIRTFLITYSNMHSGRGWGSATADRGRVPAPRPYASTIEVPKVLEGAERGCR